MTIYDPDPFSGLGILDPQRDVLLNEMAQQVQYFKELHESIEVKLLEPPAELEEVLVVSNVFFVQLLDDPVSIGANRWEYEWAEVEILADDTYALLENGRTSADPDRGPALNLYEQKNTDLFVMGGVAVAPLPGDIVVLSAAAGNDGSEDRQVVELTEKKRTDDSLAYRFLFPNGVQPTCPIPILPPPPIIQPGVLA